VACRIIDLEETHMNEAVEIESQSVQFRLAALTTEHHDLDAAISRMAESRIYNDEQLHRLKKKKLLLKDQIATLERRLGHPPNA